MPLVPDTGLLSPRLARWVEARGSIPPRGAFQNTAER